MKVLLLAGASCLLAFGAAAAQPAANSTPAPHMTGAALQQQVTQNLQQSGFTDIKIMPDSFLVQAKDKSGNPITMMINPDSVTEVLALGTSGADRMPGTPQQTGTFVTVPPDERMSTQLVGTVVRNDSNQELGTIKDLAFNGPNLQAYIVQTQGGRDVAISPAAIQMIWDHGAKMWHATMNATQAQIASAPPYRQG